jgi:hypothetical protein
MQLTTNHVLDSGDRVYVLCGRTRANHGVVSQLSKIIATPTLHTGGRQINTRVVSSGRNIQGSYRFQEKIGKNEYSKYRDCFTQIEPHGIVFGLLTDRLQLISKYPEHILCSTKNK